jgi:8-oxo-dGTP pyrophosphatase MutT (NUDIX family)
MNNSIRQQIKNLITAITPFDEIEQNHIQDTLNWIDSDVEIFRIEKPATPLKHLVTFTVFVDPIAKKVLLLEHKKALLLLPNGGHVDKDELPFNTALRELKEEMHEEGTFLFDPQRPFFIDQMVTVGLTAGHTDVTLWYVFQRDSNKPINDQLPEFQREFDKYYWLTFDEILHIDIKKLNANMHRFVRKLQSQELFIH